MNDISLFYHSFAPKNPYPTDWFYGDLASSIILGAEDYLDIFNMADGSKEHYVVIKQDKATREAFDKGEKFTARYEMPRRKDDANPTICEETLQGFSNLEEALKEVRDLYNRDVEAGYKVEVSVDLSLYKVCKEELPEEWLVFAGGDVQPETIRDFKIRNKDVPLSEQSLLPVPEEISESDSITFDSI